MALDAAKVDLSSLPDLKLAAIAALSSVPPSDL
jgi:hypothetical protein